MTDFKFNIRKVFPGTEKQKNVGIHATFSMTMDGPDGIIVAMNDMKLMKSRDGDYYIDSAFRSYDGKDRETGQPKKMKINYVKLFPEKENRDKRDAVVKLVLAELENAPASAPRQQAPARASSTAPNDEPW